jgi:hypothetical protein
MLFEPRSELLVATGPLRFPWFIGLAPKRANPMNQEYSFIPIFSTNSTEVERESQLPDRMQMTVDYPPVYLDISQYL